MKKLVLSIGFVGVCGLGGCASTGRPFVKTDGPSTSSGVTVALKDQRCARRKYDKMNDVLDLRMAVQVTNGSPTPVTVDPTEFRLLARGNEAVADSTPPTGNAPETALPPGGSAPVDVRFRRFGNARCNQDMQLSLDRAVEKGGHEVPLRPITFMPERNDT